VKLCCGVICACGWSRQLFWAFWKMDSSPWPLNRRRENNLLSPCTHSWADKVSGGFCWVSIFNCRRQVALHTTYLPFMISVWRSGPRTAKGPRTGVSQSVDLGQNNNPNTTPTKDYENVRVVVYLCGVQRGCAEEGERGSTPTGWCRQRCRILLGYRSSRWQRG